ncbi:MAG: 4-alpha-glucanotransferase [Tannerella sp.]|jgi:4-alpha-glucanotransferase|nr:4-alpha-glucanotransferase [Tannerella sp.]
MKQLFYKSAFCKNWLARNIRVQSDYDRYTGAGNFQISLSAPDILPSQTVAVAGNQPCLGWWNPTQAPLMSDAAFPMWELRLNADQITFPLEYKFIIKDNATGELICWEDGENRRVESYVANHNAFPIRLDMLKNVKIVGTAVPVFSLKSENSFGIGDIGDIKPLIDLVKRSGQNLIQLLPMNDTTRTHTRADSYPYSAISIYALHPLYINVRAMGQLNDKRRANYFKRIQKKLNSSATVDYEAVEKYKTMYCREYFDQEKANILADSGLKEFIASNREWLMPYAAFSYLRDKNGTADCSKWGEYAEYQRDKIEKLLPDSDINPCLYTFFIQYTLHRQFKEISDYARANRIVLKGDLPIGVNRESVETWTEPQYFNMQQQSGAPPDDFSETGQNWSFPTYNWDEMEKDGFAWWTKRFAKLSDYFDAIRIDHILGFFRIWEIPLEYKEGLWGHFRPALPLTEDEIMTGAGLFLPDPYEPNKFHPRINAWKTDAYKQLSEENRTAFDKIYHDFFFVRHNEFWKQTALTRLKPLIDSTDMLICGEDLGMLPATVGEVMNELQILSLELERTPKQWGVEFNDLQKLPEMSVCTTSTHDMNPIRAWWREDRNKTQRYYNNVLKRNGNAPLDCTAEIAKQIIENHISAPSMLTVIPLQDWFAADERTRRTGAPADERINIPADPHHYWCYRMHIALEECNLFRLLHHGIPA